MVVATTPEPPKLSFTDDCGLLQGFRAIYRASFLIRRPAVGRPLFRDETAFDPSPIDEHIADKIIISKAAKHAMPMPTRTGEERKAFHDTLMAELPFFLFDLLHGEVPAGYESERYGIKHYHNQEIMEILSELARDEQLLELLYAAEITSFQGSARELKQKLITHPLVGREAARLLEWHSNTGAYLGRLRRKQPKHFDDRHTNRGTLWSIELPE